MSSASNPLQKAVYELLLPLLAGLSPTTGLHDQVPKRKVYPYATLGEHIAGPWDTMTEVGEDVSFRIHTWSNYPGTKEINTINRTIKNALHLADLTVEGFGLVFLRWESTDVLGDPEDGEIRHGVLMFRAVLNDV